MTRKILFACLLCPLPAAANLFLGTSIGNTWVSHDVDVIGVEVPAEDED